MKTPLIIVWSASLLFLGAFSCTASKTPVKEVSWPLQNPTVQIREDQYLDVGLRVLAMELTQKAHRKKEYAFEFFPRLGKIEAQVLFRSPGSTGWRSSEITESFWEPKLKWEREKILSGIRELMNDLNLKEGFDENQHVEIHFQLEGRNPSEIARYQKGNLHWLLLDVSKR